MNGCGGGGQSRGDEGCKNITAEAQKNDVCKDAKAGASCNQNCALNGVSITSKSCYSWYAYL